MDATTWAEVPLYAGRAVQSIDTLISSITRAATTLLAKTDDSLTNGTDSYHKNVLVLAVAGKVDSTNANASLWRAKAVSMAVYASDNVVPGYVSGSPSTGKRRSMLMGLGWTYDLFYADLSASQKSTINAAVISMCDKMTLDPKEMLDGHSAGDQMAQLIGALAIYGDHAGAPARLQEAISFWYGGDPAVTMDAQARLAYNRYFAANGGGGKGAWYEALDSWKCYHFLEAVQNGLTGMTLDGDAYTLPGGETWIDKVGEWWLNVVIRGDMDYWKWGDTGRQDNPWFHENTRVALSYLIQNSPTWRKQLRWAYDKIQTKTESLGQSSANNRVTDFLLFELGAAANQPLAPESSTPVPSKSRLFEPPGTYFYRNNWDIGGPTHCTINIHCPTYYFLGHSADLDCGLIQINVKDDMVLLNTGMYDVDQANVADFGGTHTNNWVRQSISKSGVPLIDDLFTTLLQSPDYTSKPHVNRDFNGNVAVYSHGQGGQLHKYDPNAAASPKPIDPFTVAKMIGDGGGLTWRRTVGINGETDRGLEVKADTADLVFLTADIRRAYIRRLTDFNTADDRTEVVQLKIMIVKNEGPWPYIFRVARIKARQAAYVKRDHWHFWGVPVTDNWLAKGHFRGLGYRATEEAATAQGGKCFFAYYKHTDLQMSVVGDSSSNFTTAGANHFATFIGGSATPTRWPLSANPSVRFKPDIGRFRVEVRPKVAQLEDSFVCLICPLGVNDQAPDFTFFETQSHYGVRFGGETSQRVYKIHKTQALYEGPTDPLDTEAPAAPTGVQAAPGPGSGQVTVSWNANTEPDLAKYRVSYRVKV